MCVPRNPPSKASRNKPILERLKKKNMRDRHRTGQECHLANQHIITHLYWSNNTVILTIIYTTENFKTLDRVVSKENVNTKNGNRGTPETETGKSFSPVLSNNVNEDPEENKAIKRFKLVIRINLDTIYPSLYMTKT